MHTMAWIGNFARKLLTLHNIRTQFQQPRVCEAFMLSCLPRHPSRRRSCCSTLHTRRQWVITRCLQSSCSRCVLAQRIARLERFGPPIAFFLSKGTVSGRLPAL